MLILQGGFLAFIGFSSGATVATNKQQSVQISRFRVLVAGLCAGVMALGSGAGLANQAQPKGVGTVSFLLGKVLVTREGSLKAELLQEGDLVRPGDSLTTKEGAHVHVRFVDHGLLSVRPNSLLTIKNYEFDQSSPANSVIKFDLIEGNARSISGEGAKAARDKFRLNTPIAAIGVRGTDFVVSAQESLIRALVNEGAIVVSPFSDSCQAEGVGPCSENGVELTGNSQYFLEYSQMLTTPKLVPYSQNRMPDFMIEEVVDEPAEEASATESAENSTEEVAVSAEQPQELAAPDELDTVLDETGDLASEPEWLLDGRASEQLGDAAPTVEGKQAEDYTPATALTTDELNQRQLVWGRWSNLVSGQDRVIAKRSSIVDGRSIAVANSEFALYRRDSLSGDNAVQPGLGYVSFGLVDAQAQLATAQGAELMKVKSGWLNIDFNQSQFATGLVLNHPLTSDVTVSGQGQVTDKGYFYTRSGIDFLTGAVSYDGSEASYLFQHLIESGEIEGITYWKSN